MDTGTSLRRIYVGQKVPPRIYVKHKSTTRIRVHDKAWKSNICQLKIYIYKVIPGYIKSYTLHVYYIITQVQKKNIQHVHKRLTSKKRISWVKREESGTRGLELIGLLTKVSLVLCGWLHFVPSLWIWICKSKESRHITITNYSQVAKG